MDSANLERIGTVLYGRQWQSNLAFDLGMSSRAVRHWHTTGYVPPTKQAAIVQLVKDRAEMLTLLAGKLTD